MEGSVRLAVLNPGKEMTYQFWVDEEVGYDISLFLRKSIAFSLLISILYLELFSLFH